MENNSKSPETTKVLFNNVVIFEHERKDYAMAFALNLHRTTNVSHTISVFNDVDHFTL